MDRFPRSDSIVTNPGLACKLIVAQVYGWMTVGLLLTAICCLVCG